MLIDTKGGRDPQNDRHDMNIIILTFQRNLLLPFLGCIGLSYALKMKTVGVPPNRYTYVLNYTVIFRRTVIFMSSTTNTSNFTVF
jgi:hypothetical protein